MTIRKGREVTTLNQYSGRAIFKEGGNEEQAEAAGKW